MQIQLINYVIKILDRYKNKKTLLLIDNYYLAAPFNTSTECKDLKTYLIQNFTSEILIIDTVEQFHEVQDKFDLVINFHFSSKFSNQIDFINQVFEFSKLSGGFLNVLPFFGFVNYNSQNYNPVIFKQLNLNNNFSYSYFAFVDNFGNRIEIENKFLDKFFYQTTQKKKQNNIDFINKKIIMSMTDFSIISLSSITKLDPIKSFYFAPKRLAHHLSGHGMKTWVDEGAFNKIKDFFDIKSFLDIGCGPGGMVDYVNDCGIEALGIDGDDSIIRKKNHLFVTHDFCKSSYVPSKSYDLGWSVEFLEHVDKEFEVNYLKTFEKCKYVFVTHAPKNTKGYNHVNLEDSNYWIELFIKNNFEYLENITQEIRRSSTIEKNFIREHGLFFKNKYVFN
mgnify:CR=1 FL=1